MVKLFAIRALGVAALSHVSVKQVDELDNYAPVMCLLVLLLWSGWYWVVLGLMWGARGLDWGRLGAHRGAGGGGNWVCFFILVGVCAFRMGKRVAHPTGLGG